MTGLRTVEMTATVTHPEHRANYPTMQHAWVARLLVFQHATKADIDFKAVASSWCVVEEEDRQPIKGFESQLKTELARVRETNDAVVDVLEK